MGITIEQLMNLSSLKSHVKVKWGEKTSTKREGVYIVSLSDNPNANSGLYEKAPISQDILKKWISKVNGFEIDKETTFDTKRVIDRMGKFWLPNENIVYIGKAPRRANGKALDNRISEYYRTQYGEKRPHAGGHWIKSLGILDDLNVYAIPCDNPGDVEASMLEYFVSNVSNIPINDTLEPSLCLPFANLQLNPKVRRVHGLGKMKVK